MSKVPSAAETREKFLAACKVHTAVRKEEKEREAEKEAVERLIKKDAIVGRLQYLIPQRIESAAGGAYNSCVIQGEEFKDLVGEYGPKQMEDIFALIKEAFDIAVDMLELKQLGYKVMHGRQPTSMSIAICW